MVVRVVGAANSFRMAPSSKKVTEIVGGCTLLTVCVCVGGEGGADESVRGGVSMGEEGMDDESLSTSESMSERVKDCELGVVVYKSKMSAIAGETGEQIMVAVTAGPDIDAIA